MHGECATPAFVRFFLILHHRDTRTSKCHGNSPCLRHRDLIEGMIGLAIEVRLDAGRGLQLLYAAALGRELERAGMRVRREAGIPNALQGRTTPVRHPRRYFGGRCRNVRAGNDEGNCGRGVTVTGLGRAIHSADRVQTARRITSPGMRLKGLRARARDWRAWRRVFHLRWRSVKVPGAQAWPHRHRDKANPGRMLPFVMTGLGRLPTTLVVPPP